MERGDAVRCSAMLCATTWGLTVSDCCAAVLCSTTPAQHHVVLRCYARRELRHYGIAHAAGCAICLSVCHCTCI